MVVPAAHPKLGLSSCVQADVVVVEKCTDRSYGERRSIGGARQVLERHRFRATQTEVHRDHVVRQHDWAEPVMPVGSARRKVVRRSEPSAGATVAVDTDTQGHADVPSRRPSLLFVDSPTATR